MRARCSTRPTALTVALAVALATALATACHRPAPPAPSARPARVDRDVISLAEINAATGAQDAYDVVKQLRPSFLVERGPGSLRAATARRALVYVDNVRVGTVEWLRNIPRGELAEIRYFSGLDATTRWGTGHGAGVIYVSTRR